MRSCRPSCSASAWAEAGVEYAFRHPLTQEVAYRSQLSDRRRHVHREVALAIEQLYPERLDELAALRGPALGGGR